MYNSLAAPLLIATLVPPIGAEKTFKSIQSRPLETCSLEEIGRQFGGRHYTTVLHAISKIEAMRRTDEALNRAITRLVELSLRPED